MEKNFGKNLRVYLKNFLFKVFEKNFSEKNFRVFEKKFSEKNFRVFEKNFRGAQESCI